MAILPRPARPSALIADAKRVWRTSTSRYKLVFGALAIAMVSLIVTGFIVESRWGILPEGEQITYASDWSDNRTDAEIISQQRIDAVDKRKADDERRRAFQRLDDAMTKHGL